MSGKWTARGGWTVEAIVLDDRPRYGVTRYGFLVHNDGRGYCYSLAELERVLAAHGLWDRGPSRRRP